MGREEHTATAVRRRDSAATKAAILNAAREAFTEHGYDGAGVRDIARAAEVDARLIGRYFGSKEGLFAAVVDVVFEKSIMMTPAGNADAARDLLTGTGSVPTAGLLLTLRSAPNPRAAEIMRENIEGNYARRLAGALDGPDAEGRAGLLVAICSGVLLSRLVLGHTAFTGPDVERLVPYLHAALDAVAKDPTAEGSAD
ncbi:TetR/AcrR family transcriptional regulator [Amycolatopsis sp. NBRC 101858]|uniref:TetR/AcrR family transcriptional regulator n=1 Tax=Amycolatopsis sp. NBRC 101858 TaxID=3032200 RepID=UPI0025577277|nr:TetR/AcrR family transcriptional regulator [Amycolatopsis sp. NBRC 101858]